MNNLKQIWQALREVNRDEGWKYPEREIGRIIKAVTPYLSHGITEDEARTCIKLALEKHGEKWCVVDTAIIKNLNALGLIVEPEKQEEQQSDGVEFDSIRECLNCFCVYLNQDKIEIDKETKYYLFACIDQAYIRIAALEKEIKEVMG